MIYIEFTDGKIQSWSEKSYTDYMYHGSNGFYSFVILNGDKWVGIYNMQEVRMISIGEPWIGANRI